MCEAKEAGSPAQASNFAAISAAVMTQWFLVFETYIKGPPVQASRDAAKEVAVCTGLGSPAHASREAAKEVAVFRM